MSTLHYSIFKYSQFKTSTAPIILGILFHEPTTNCREFRYTHDLSRLSQLDPEVDVELVKKLLCGIKEDVESERFDHKVFDIEDYTRFYLNAFCFEGPKTVEYDVLDETIAQISKKHL